MSRSRNSRKGSRKSHAMMHPDCPCFICERPVLKIAVFKARLVDHDRRQELKDPWWPSWVEERVSAAEDEYFRHPERWVRHDRQ